ncbi:LOB domain-containing protein 24-like [Papaver somniferum]|uniref:LOB domain-containing protein 24-like n=1 Tax=Papaver somniferum TaxID=3469 RepID=UPI000E705E8B|nr:LOB domain-containing protein 24-like [Papaver somniferum]
MVKIDRCEKCRFDRHRCPANCRYAQFFPLGTDDDYKAVHKVFGARKFLSIVDRADPEQNIASQSLIRQARARVADPVNGLGGSAMQLRGQVNQLRAELISVGIPIRGDIVPQEPPRRCCSTGTTGGRTTSAEREILWGLQASEKNVSINLSSTSSIHSSKE